jgi:hypothetical protein
MGLPATRNEVGFGEPGELRREGRAVTRRSQEGKEESRDSRRWGRVRLRLGTEGGSIYGSALVVWPAPAVTSPGDC